MDNLYTYIADLKARIPEIPENSIVSQTVLSNEQLKVVLFGFAPRQELSEHTASQPALLHFVDGTAQLTLGKDKMSAQAGTWVHMEPNLPHSIHADTQVTMLLILLKR
jgi:quercetin dioxygenase-like cupin family protein